MADAPLDVTPSQTTHRGWRQVVCVNERCLERHEVKGVRLPHLGNGVYLAGQMLCGSCDAPVHVVAPAVTRGA